MGELMTGSYFHYLHHRFVSCNYGEATVPLDLVVRVVLQRGRAYRTKTQNAAESGVGGREPRGRWRLEIDPRSAELELGRAQAPVPGIRGARAFLGLRPEQGAPFEFPLGAGGLEAAERPLADAHGSGSGSPYARGRRCAACASAWSWAFTTSAPSCSCAW